VTAADSACADAVIPTPPNPVLTWRAQSVGAGAIAREARLTLWDALFWGLVFLGSAVVALGRRVGGAVPRPRSRLPAGRESGRD
jgi:hypothetical protein